MKKCAILLLVLALVSCKEYVWKTGTIGECKLVFHKDAYISWVPIGGLRMVHHPEVNRYECPVTFTGCNGKEYTQMMSYNRDVTGGTDQIAACEKVEKSNE